MEYWYEKWHCPKMRLVGHSEMLDDEALEEPQSIGRNDTNRCVCLRVRACVTNLCVCVCVSLTWPFWRRLVVKNVVIVWMKEVPWIAGLWLNISMHHSLYVLTNTPHFSDHVLHQSKTCNSHPSIITSLDREIFFGIDKVKNSSLYEITFSYNGTSL